MALAALATAVPPGVCSREPGRDFASHLRDPASPRLGASPLARAGGASGGGPLRRVANGDRAWRPGRGGPGATLQVAVVSRWRARRAPPCRVPRSGAATVSFAPLLGGAAPSWVARAGAGGARLSVGQRRRARTWARDQPFHLQLRTRLAHRLARRCPLVGIPANGKPALLDWVLQKWL